MRTVRIIAGVKSRNSSRNIFMRLRTTSLSCEYIFTLVKFLSKYPELFQTNSAMHIVNARNGDHVLRPISKFHVLKKLHTMLA